MIKNFIISGLTVCILDIKVGCSVTGVAEFFACLALTVALTFTITSGEDVIKDMIKESRGRK